MPKEVSEATAETAQVESPPSEEAQVAEPAPSEEEKPVQEPEETPEQQRERLYKELLESEEHQKAVQSEADKRALKLRQEMEAQREADRRQTEQERRLQEAKAKREHNQGIYRQLQLLEQQKPDEWRQHMRNPEYAAIWNEGLNTVPSTDEIDAAKAEARAEAGLGVLNQLATKIKALPEMENLTDEDLKSLDRGNFAQSLDGYVEQLLQAAKIYGVKVGRAEAAKGKAALEESIRKDEREKLQAKYREAGVVPEEIEGKPAPGVLTEAQYLAMSPDDREKLREEHPEKVDAMTKKMMGI